MIKFTKIKKIVNEQLPGADTLSAYFSANYQSYQRSREYATEFFKLVLPQKPDFLGLFIEFV
ncbi:MAG: hypothetical protein BWY45_00085 [Euryarchaeota archaeon ADurb.Bin294]|jgi:hypothetical protein|nr:MAG: hypothetical protein BWY45_00085 [Euryarchaeota archaeon ADurb.Bin294]